MGNLWQDLKYGARIVAKNPGFTLVVVLTLALGIGANTAIFTVVNSVMLSSLPVKDPQQLALLSDPNFSGMDEGSSTGDRGALTYAEFRALAERNDVSPGFSLWT